MPSPEEILGSLGLDALLDDHAFSRDEAGTLVNPAGLRVVCAPGELTRALRLVLEQQRAGSWPAVSAATGRRTGSGVAALLDRELARLGKPALSALPLETCLVLIERYLALHGWGRVQFDLSDADAHGLVVARVEQSYAVESLPEADGFVDALLAGWLQGFFEHLTGQPLGCLEIACARRAAPHCVFVLTAPERLEVVAPLVGQQPAEAILQRLKS